MQRTVENELSGRLHIHVGGVTKLNGPFTGRFIVEQIKQEEAQSGRKSRGTCDLNRDGLLLVRSEHFGPLPLFVNS